MAKKKIGQKLKQAVQKVAVKTSQGVKHVSQGVAKAAKKVVDKGKDAAMMTLFVPFAPLARIFLKRRGVAPAKDLRSLALQVHNERSKKSFGYTGPDSFDYGLTGENEFGQLDELGVEHQDFGLIPVTPGMVMAVITFLKEIFEKIKEKKAKGEALSPDEQEIYNNASQIEASLQEAKDQASSIQNDSESKADEMLTGGNVWKIVLVVVILLILFFTLRSKFGK